MILAILFALTFAKLKGFKLKPLLTTYALYPFAILTVIMLYLQARVFFHDYRWIKYAQYIQSAYLFSLSIPFLIYKLYKPGLLGALFIVLGTIMNKFVIGQNGGKMPVFATLSKLTGYYSETMISTADTIHIAGDASTKYRLLTDYIDLGYTILSIGDILIYSFAFIILYYVVKEVNTRQAND